jgi:hypothetical protein
MQICWGGSDIIDSSCMHFVVIPNLPKLSSLLPTHEQGMEQEQSRRMQPVHNGTTAVDNYIESGS